ncbi:dihydrofolate reductase family protein [Virgisporangium aurantiacum]|uniref:DNA-binding protein n=1 Tax=Virgisporangium aurantiacum TaxID=175570 RepID=A0A8J3Z9U3_9ACTN|nr:dihydrofolate reductase family protein [Virgisporangium aurantiacum]GIJ60229.1 DNA-binding protein [Virgisporangium aurantiacum]
MSKVVVDMAASLDGYTAGPNQSLEKPFGDDAFTSLTDWMTQAAEENKDELDAITDAGAFVMGRNMFGPGRGAWDRTWRGWWGEDPPYHAPVFVLTHHERPAEKMAGGTTFHFVTGGIDEALRLAREAAGDRNVSVAGGAATVNQFLAAGLVDELRLHVTPVLLGRGERLFTGTARTELTQVSARRTSLVTHLRYEVRRA